MVSRKEKLQAMLDMDPADQTCRYMLAMELDKCGDSQGCVAHFQHLMQDAVPYVPAFLMAGQLLTRLGQNEEAKACFQQGIQQAKAQGNDHAAGEMTQFLNELT